MKLSVLTVAMLFVIYPNSVKHDSMYQNVAEHKHWHLTRFELSSLP